MEPQPGVDPPDEVQPEVEPAPVDPLPDPTPRIRVLMAQLTTERAPLEVQHWQAALDEAVEALGAAAAAADAARDQVALAKDGVTGAERILAEMAVEAFMRGGGAVSVAEAELGTYELRKTEALVGSVMEHQKTEIERRRGAVGAVEAQLAPHEAAVAAAAAVVGERQVALAAAMEAAAGADAELEASRSGYSEHLFDAADLSGWQLPIAGESLFTADELAAWASSRAVASRASVGVAELARMFVEEGHDEGIRGDVAFAQAVLETGWFTNDDTARFNNFAGIGHCDTCPTGWSFGSARDGVRAQIQLLKSYVEVRPTYVHPLVDGRLRGPAGCCTSWNALTGVWATSPVYGPMVLGIYLEMLEWLSATQPSPPG